MARENNITIRRLAKPRNVHEASGAKLNIIGTCDMYVKLKVIGKTKQLRFLILRGSSVARGEYFTKILQTFPKGSAVNSSLKVMRKSQFPSRIA